MDEITDIWEWLADNLPKIAFIAMTVAVIASFAAAVGGIVVSENSRIGSGVIVDKYMDPGGRMHSYPVSYHFTINGIRDGEEVEYTFEVSESDYAAYKIGDYYRR